MSRSDLVYVALGYYAHILIWSQLCTLISKRIDIHHTT